MEKNGQSFYYQRDGLGSITEITNQSGSVVQRYAYSSFGKIESQLDANFVQPYTFTARELDQESGLYYFRSRFYDSALGRFISEDPKGFAAGVNFYGYVNSNPTGRVDPYGLDWLDNLSNFSAGTGDFLSGGFMNSFNLTARLLGHRAVPVSQLFRQLLVQSIGLDDVVDQCSTGYTLGTYTGGALGASLIWTAGLSAGANTVIYSPLSAVTRAQQLGTALGSTPIGGLLNLVNDVVQVPRAVWYIASGTYAANASGRVPAVIESMGKIVQFEMRILNWRSIPIDR